MGDMEADIGDRPVELAAQRLSQRSSNASKSINDAAQQRLARKAADMAEHESLEAAKFAYEVCSAIGLGSRPARVLFVSGTTKFETNTSANACIARKVPKRR